jgi:hypothetical protein
MLTVIFGAGASYDSDPENPSAEISRPWLDMHRPPLAKDLFNPHFGSIAENHEDALPLFSQLRRAARRNPPNVEEELEQISLEATTYTTVHYGYYPRY